MAAITLAQAFGANAAINAGVLSITIADFADVGLSNASPSASELLTAILLKVRASQDSTSQEDIERGVYIGDPYNTISRSDTQLERQYPFSVFTPLNISALDPDDVVG